MSLHASTIASLERALRVVLSPLDHPCRAAWVSAALRELRPVVGADATSALLEAHGAPEFHRGDVDAAAVDEYARYYHRCDTGFAVRRRQLGLEVWTTRALWDPRELRASEYWNDYKVPHRLHDALGISVGNAGTGPSVPTLFFYRSTPRRPFSAAARQLGALVLPAFRAAARALAVVGAPADRLGAVLDAITGAVCAFDLRGALHFQNRAANRLFASTPPGAQLRQEALRAAAALAGPARTGNGCGAVAHQATRDVDAGGRRYRITATWVRDHGIGPEPLIVVCVERAGRELPAPSQLAARFGLTRREADVTQLLLQGRSNADIAASLAISEHTARHHTERVMVKLGVHSRAQVAPTLLGGAPIAD